MTHLEGDDVNDGGRIMEVEVDLIHTNDGGGDYIKLKWPPQDSQPEPALPSLLSASWYWLKLLVSFLCLGLLALVVFKWVGPFFIDKVFFFFLLICSFPSSYDHHVMLRAPYYVFVSQTFHFS